VGGDGVDLAEHVLLLDEPPERPEVVGEPEGVVHDE